MAADEKKKETGAAASVGPTQTVGQTKIVWDDSNMRSVYANVSNVAGGREEIVLLFGMNQAWRPDAEEIEVDLANRIVMSPYASKRLSLLLNSALKQYEDLYGKIEVGK